MDCSFLHISQLICLNLTARNLLLVEGSHCANKSSRLSGRERPANICRSAAVTGDLSSIGEVGLDGVPVSWKSSRRARALKASPEDEASSFSLPVGGVLVRLLAVLSLLPRTRLRLRLRILP